MDPNGVSPIAIDALAARRDELARQFRLAQPFPHVVLSDFLSLDPAETARFPDASWPHWKRLRDYYQHQKTSCSDLDAIPEPWCDVIRELSSPTFLRLLEEITGLEKLLPDPYLEGGGLHMSGPGGHLEPHTDFHVYAALGLYRRVNLLLYLNSGWREDSGGDLALYGDDATSPVVEVSPAFGTCVIFETDDRSVHGVQPVAADSWRKSIALYYYTSAPAPSFSGDESTHWRTHGEVSGFRRIRVGAYLVLMKGSRLFSMLAHLVNPHHGLRMLRERVGELRQKRNSDS